MSYYYQLPKHDRHNEARRVLRCLPRRMVTGGVLRTYDRGRCRASRRDVLLRESERVHRVRELEALAP